MFDIAVIGGGIFGSSIAYWLGNLFEGRFVVLEKEPDVARHSSGRNTGVIHRPFYLDPMKKRVFARCAESSYHFWKWLAARRSLPWLECGTLKVAFSTAEIRELQRYQEWGRANGMDASEMRLLEGTGARALAPGLKCAAALQVRTDTSVDYAAFTRALRDASGVEFRYGFDVLREPPPARFVINCAGGRSLDVAWRFGLARNLAALHFRGEYLRIDPAFGTGIRCNLYSVPRHSEYPFLDPHFILRTDGRREVGPSAVPVGGPHAYDGFFSQDLFRGPLANRLKVLFRTDFWEFALEEWASSLSQAHMLNRVRRFLPALNESHVLGPGTAGIRSVIVDPDGRLVPEAIVLEAPTSLHVLNYNSPGATGAPAFAAQLVRKLALPRKRGSSEVSEWFDRLTQGLEVRDLPH